MTSTDQLRFTHPTHRTGKAAALALRLAEAENALHALTSGQVDALSIPVAGLTFGLLIARGIAAALGGNFTVANETSRQNAPFRLNFKISSEVKK